MVLYVPRFQHAACLGVGGASMTEALDRSTLCLQSCIYTLVPVSVNYSLTKASVGG